MPSVGMRRTTRVFGVVKGADGARVLRSGRRLWPESDVVKLRKCDEGGGDWLQPLIKKSNGNRNGPGGLKCKPNGWAHAEETKMKRSREVVAAFYEHDDTEMKVFNKVERQDEEEKAMVEDKMFGNVYTRKRKRNGGTKKEISEDKMHGIKYFRRRKRKKIEESSISGDSDRVLSKRKSRGSRVFGVVFEGSYSRSSGFLCFLNLVMGFLKNERIKLRGLASFLLSQPTTAILSPHGLRCLWDPPVGGTGMCKLFGAMGVTPLFSMDFSAVPFCFMYIHLKMLFRLESFPSVHVNNNSESLDSDDVDIIDHHPSDIHKTESLVPVACNTANKLALHPSMRASKLAGRNVQSRNGPTSRGIQKRRSSLRRRKARNPPLLGTHKANGALVSDLINSRKNGSPFSSTVSKNKLRSSARRSVSFTEVGSTMERLSQSSNTSCCLAGILVTQSDRCCRESGATVMLEMSASKEWLLVVKKDGLTRYRHKAQKVMRPCSTNRFTHAMVWTGDDNWKLEFPSRQDWLLFKDLYKECYERNVHVSGKVIPVPRVSEVSGYEDTNSVPFHRPDLYISVNDDEVSRALARRTANYDMDSEDEEWLKKFNNEHFTEDKVHELVSEDNFELMVDAFEKAHYCSPDDFSDEKAAADLCLDLGQREVVQAVYDYWMKKRKQKRSSLLRVFQIRQVKKTSVIPKPALRKRRSFKRQASQAGRGKQPVLLQAMAVEQEALDEKNAMLKVEETKSAASRAVELAIFKRKRAQLLMENADLVSYKAAVALRIAEAAQVAESVEAIADHFLDDPEAVADE